MYTYENYLLEAIETVSSWDVPEDEFAGAVNAQARLLYRIPSDDYWQPDLDVTIQ